MSFSIQRIETPQPIDNLLILTDTTNLLWAGKYLTAAEQAYLAHAATKGINHIFFPKGTQGILIHFIGLMNNTGFFAEVWELDYQSVVLCNLLYEVIKIQRTTRDNRFVFKQNANPNPPKTTHSPSQKPLAPKKLDITDYPLDKPHSHAP